jgi:hypothetical protein
VPSGGTSIPGTSGATTGASALTPADDAESISPSSGASTMASSVTQPGRSICSLANAGVVLPTTSGPNGATGAACPMSAASSGPVAPSGASHSTPDGGSRRAADAGRPCHICGSASTTPKLPTPEPP